jgi:aspartyl-tRNA synthetase
MRVTEEGLESNITKYFSSEIQKNIIKAVKARPGSILLYIADKEAKANELLSKLRAHLAEKLGLIDEKKFCFCWITEFPLFEYDPDLQAWKPMHHMFTMPTEETIPFLEKDPGKVIGKLFDLVLNGTELASGSMRIHDTRLQERVMAVIGMSKEEAHSKFGFLLEAYKYGAPMHGGMGLGFDRTVALMLGYSDIREVIAFPKNKAAECPMDSSPGQIEKDQLKELHLKLDIVKQQKE